MAIEGFEIASAEYTYNINPHIMAYAHNTA